jgi:predicted Zn-dependent protease
MATKKLEDILQGPLPTPEDLKAAQAAGAVITGYDPRRLEAFVAGHITLGELEGIPKEAQHEMAKTGFRLFTEGKLDQAKKVFLGLLALDPYDAYFLAALGAIANQQGELEEAEQRFTRALEINPYSIAALAGRGEVRLARGQLVEAAADLAQAITEDKDGKDPAGERARGLAANVKRLIEGAQAEQKAQGR